MNLGGTAEVYYSCPMVIIIGQEFFYLREKLPPACLRGRAFDSPRKGSGKEGMHSENHTHTAERLFSLTLYRPTGYTFCVSGQILREKKGWNPHETDNPL
jgi:hypothetical protein